MSCKTRLETYLRDNRVDYQLQHHPQAFTAQGVANTMHLSNQAMVKVVMAFADDKLVMLVLPAGADVDLKDAAYMIGAKKVQLAQEKDFEALFPDCELGAMPPFGNLYNLPVYIDHALAQNEMIYFQAGNHIDTMSIRYKDFIRLVNPVVDVFTGQDALSFNG